jgi:hypothetical protein
MGIEIRRNRYVIPAFAGMTNSTGDALCVLLKFQCKSDLTFPAKILRFTANLFAGRCVDGIALLHTWRKGKSNGLPMSVVRPIAFSSDPPKDDLI